MSGGKDMAALWRQVSVKLLPFADVANASLPLSRILRLSLFQVSVGMAVVLLNGTLNRVMIVELGVPVWAVSSMIALPLLFAPFRALIGHRSDNHRSAFGWRRGPYIWFGTLAQFGGLAIMPFALLVLSGEGNGFVWLGYLAGALAFLMVGFGLHTVQTAGLALATDIASPAARPRVVALLYVMLLGGMALSSLIYSVLLTDFTQIKLIQIIQGSAFVTIVLNVVALWKQEARDPNRAAGKKVELSFREAWRSLTGRPQALRLLAATGVGAAAFSMQDALLEPFGGQVLGMTVSQTTILTAIFAMGSILGFGIAARQLSKHAEPHRLAGFGALVGVLGFTILVLSTGVLGPMMFMGGVGLIGLGGGVFAVCTLIAIMMISRTDQSGIALGAWGAVQASATGLAVALGGGIRDGVAWLSAHDAIGPALIGPAVGYGTVYVLEVVMLFLALAIIGPLAKHSSDPSSTKMEKIGLEAFPS